MRTRGDNKAHWLAYLLPNPAVLGLIPCVPRIFSEEKIINVAEVNHWHWLEERVQCLENVDQTHLVPASGRQVLQKKYAQKPFVHYVSCNFLHCRLGFFFVLFAWFLLFYVV